MKLCNLNFRPIDLFDLIRGEAFKWNSPRQDLEDSGLLHRSREGLVVPFCAINLEAAIDPANVECLVKTSLFVTYH